MGVLGSKILQQIKAVSDVEVEKSQVMLAIFLRKMEEKVDSSIEELRSGLKYQVEFYGRKVADYNDKIESIVDKYTNEITKVTDEYENLYVNVELELQEALSNQKIAVANLKKIADTKEKFLNSEKFKEYNATKLELKEQLANCEKKVEFDRISALLDNLVNPIDLYNKKMDACVKKYYDYNQIVETCEKKKLECLTNIGENLDEVINSAIERALVNVKPSPFDFIRKIVNVFNGKTKLEKNVLEKMENKIQVLSEQNNGRIENIENSTIEFVSSILSIKDTIKREFNSAIE